MQQRRVCDGASAAPRVNVFMAIFPDAKARTAIAALADEVCARYALRAPPRPAALLHATLHHLGEYAGLPSDLVERVETAMDGFVTAPFDVAFDRVGSFASARRAAPCVLLGRAAPSPLHALAAALASRLQRAGFGASVERAFAPHVTLAYDARAVPTTAVPPIGWRVDACVLVRSLIGRSTYDALARWTLDG